MIFTPLRTVSRALPRTACIVMAAAAILAAAPADHSHHAGQHHRDIKALSDEQIEGLLAGQGLGLALAAELNGYPGPRHVLELADELELTAGQHARTQALFDDMLAEAKALGRELVEAEHALDALFASGEITPALLDDTLTRIGALQVQLRGVHLGAHLEQARILTPEQIAHYSWLRGYNDHKLLLPGRINGVE